jgi:thiamine pyrophosphate-dependent acetolactate synthase large subunit-like protein
MSSAIDLYPSHQVRATRAKTVEEFADAFSKALATAGPSLIEAVLY